MASAVVMLALVAGTVTLAALPAAPAHAAERSLDVRVRTTGVLSVVWHGDPARGCAAAGMCGIEGSVTYRPVGDIEVTFDPDGGTGFSFGENRAAVVRVRRAVQGGAPATCTDLIPMDFESQLADAFEGQLAIGFEDVQLSSGRCAGPRALDLVPALPRRILSVRALARRGHDLDLTGRSPFKAGPFSGEVVSTVKVQVGRGRPTRAAGVAEAFGPRIIGGPGRSRRLVGIGLTYRAAPLRGAIVSEFAGLHSPACRLLDACGARGRSTLEITSRAGLIDLFAVQPARGRRPSLPALLRALRRGALPLVGFAQFPNMSARVSEQVTLPGGESCADSVFATAPEPVVRTGPGRVAVVLASAGDTVRTHCPGPTEDDVTHTEVLARASFALRDVGRRRMSLALGTPRSFSALGFAGTRRGSLPLDLRLVDVYVAYGS